FPGKNVNCTSGE
nr:Chain A, Lustrin A [synthetic construct]